MAILSNAEELVFEDESTDSNTSALVKTLIPVCLLVAGPVADGVPAYDLPDATAGRGESGTKSI